MGIFVEHDDSSQTLPVKKINQNTQKQLNNSK